MICHVCGIVRMTVSQFRHHRFKCIEKVKVRAGIQIGYRQRGSRVKDEKVAYPNTGFLMRKLLTTEFGEINNLPLLLSANV